MLPAPTTAYPLDLLLSDYVLLGLAAVLAGLVDAVVGGGGLIQLPALFSVLPQTLPATLFGTNKLAAIWGTAVAARAYAKRLPLDWSIAIPAAAAALLCAFFGARTVSFLPPDVLRKALPFVLLAVAIYVFRRKDFGTEPVPDTPIFMTVARKRGLALLIGGVIGFYDGFFGPGTGSFLIFLFVRVFYLDFLQASALAKVVNVACNFAALAWFGAAGYVIWQLGLMMAVCNVVGALIGTRLAMWGGAGLVRKLFLIVVGLLIIKTGINAY